MGTAKCLLYGVLQDYYCKPQKKNRHVYNNLQLTLEVVKDVAKLSGVVVMETDVKTGEPSSCRCCHCFKAVSYTHLTLPTMAVV